MRNTMMINMLEVNETNNMIDHEKLDVRTITMGISLLDCCGSTVDEINEKSTERLLPMRRTLSPQEMRLEENLAFPLSTSESQ